MSATNLLQQLYILGITEVWFSCPKVLPKNQPHTSFTTVWQYCLGITKPKVNPKPYQQAVNENFKISLTEFSTTVANRLTNWLMSSDKILNNVDIPNHYIPTVTNSRTRGHSQRFQQFQAHLDVYLYSFFPTTLKMWSSSPATIIEIRNVENLRRECWTILIITQLLYINISVNSCICVPSLEFLI